MFGISFSFSQPLIVLIVVVAVAAVVYVANRFFGFSLGFDTSGMFQTIAKIYQGATAPRPKPRGGFFA